jgi:hypothetical protein
VHGGRRDASRTWSKCGSVPCAHAQNRPDHETTDGTIGEITRDITIEGDVPEHQRARLMEIMSGPSDADARDQDTFEPGVLIVAVTSDQYLRQFWPGWSHASAAAIPRRSPDWR